MKTRHWILTLFLTPTLLFAQVTTTPLMGLDLPVPGARPGPSWAQDLNDAMTLVDSHDHTTGKGSRVPTGGININAALPMNGYDLSLPRSVMMTNHGSTLAGVNDKSSVYVVNGNLYYNNASGTAIQLTSGAGLNAASIGGIGGDYATSTASAFYTDLTKTFSFTQSSGVPAKMSIGDLSISETASSTQAITLKSPAALGAAYTLTLPAALPASKKIVTMTNAGVIAADYDADNSTLEVSSNNLRIKDQGVTQAKLAARATGTSVAAGGLAISASSGAWSSASSSFEDVTNLSVTITTTGRPVRIELISDGTTSTLTSDDVGAIGGAGVNPKDYQILRGASVIGFYRVQGSSPKVPLSSISFVDTPAAGTYTYKLQGRETGGANNYKVGNAKLIAYEL